MYVIEDKMRNLPNNVITYSELVLRRGKVMKRRRMFYCNGHVSQWYWSRWKCWESAKQWHKLTHKSLRQRNG